MISVEEYKNLETHFWMLHSGISCSRAEIDQWILMSYYGERELKSRKREQQLYIIIDELVKLLRASDER